MMNPIAIPRIESVAIAVVLRLAGLHRPKSAQLMPLALILQVAMASVVADQKRPLAMKLTEEKYTSRIRNITDR